jgi:hypothetical protein
MVKVLTSATSQGDDKAPFTPPSYSVPSAWDFKAVTLKFIPP